MLDPILPWLATMAAGELAERELHYPRRIEQGRMTAEEAGTAIAAWRGIAELFSGGEAMTSLSFAELAHELRRAFAALCHACDRHPGDQLRLERREAVQAMLRRVEWHQEQATARPAPSGDEGPTGQGRLAA